MMAVDRIRQLGWEVQPVDFAHQLQHENLSPLRGVQLPETESGQILASYPDYFVMHQAFPPKRGQSSPVREGAFFVAVVSESGIPWAARAAVLTQRFPGPILVLSSNSASKGYWLHDETASERTLEELVAEIS